MNEVDLREQEEQLVYLERARELVAELAERLGRAPRACVVTFGCQMNARDSEKLIGILKSAGYEITEDEDAEFLIYNTCTVRDNANQRLYGRLGSAGSLKRKREERQKAPGGAKEVRGEESGGSAPFAPMKIALCGCMMQERTAVEKIQQSYGFVDLIFGTHNLYKFPEYLVRVLGGPEGASAGGEPEEAKGPDAERDKPAGDPKDFQRGGRIVEIRDSADRIVEELPAQRKYPFKSGVNIMFGCDNFCTYCIVPYVRGRERSREARDILREVERLAADGVSEVMLLGQNVNSYGTGLPGAPTFAQLLREVCGVDGIRRVRFMTSHPKDLSDELIRVMAEQEKVCRHLHLPLQAGSDRILKAMNRRYTKEQYIRLALRIREAIPDLALTTDIMVGFPGETAADVDETLDVIRRVRFDNAFTFVYSPRTVTPAASYPDQVSDAWVREQFDRVLALVQETAREAALRWQGRVMDALVEEENAQTPGLVTGRLGNNMIVHFPGDASLLGQIVPVHLAECRGFYYLGERA